MTRPVRPNVPPCAGMASWRSTAGLLLLAVSGSRRGAYDGGGVERIWAPLMASGGQPRVPMIPADQDATAEGYPTCESQVLRGEVEFS